MSNKTCYACPLENVAFEACQGCPFRTREDGKYWCHLASKNFMYDSKACDLGLFPLIFPREYHVAELRYVQEDGRTVSQINVGDLDGTKESTQAPVKDLVEKLASDSLPKFRKRRR